MAFGYRIILITSLTSRQLHCHHQHERIRQRCGEELEVTLTSALTWTLHTMMYVIDIVHKRYTYKTMQNLQGLVCDVHTVEEGG